MTKESLIEVLEVACTIVFIKKNGDTRKMHCIINEDQPATFANSDAVGVIESLTGAFRAIKSNTVLSVNGEMV
jgi:hypothetical protein